MRSTSFQIRKSAGAVALAAALAFPASAGPAAAAKTKDIFGWVERVEVGRHEITLKAKLDTGAATSSLDAQDIRRLVRRSTGERSVEFTLHDPESGDSIRLKKPLVREVRIKQHDGSHQVRPVVVIDICVGDHFDTVEVSLIDRSEFLYPMLLGRSALEGRIVVDPELTFTQDPDCDEEERSRKGAP
ncbi:MAG: ATP-dependent zinc protease [Thermoanaerobaculia bacterium]